MWLKVYCGNEKPTYLVAAQQFYPDGSFSGPYICLDSWTGKISSKHRQWGRFNWQNWLTKVEKM